mmetsp:Transcript_22277/g.61819  ORF Transcript_22277/g.61819 Transcript_22277/m.61819 type:complete len:84 (+) Transcript_22277:419-670(+)
MATGDYPNPHSRPNFHPNAIPNIAGCHPIPNISSTAPPSSTHAGPHCKTNTCPHPSPFPSSHPIPGPKAACADRNHHPSRRGV